MDQTSASGRVVSVNVSEETGQIKHPVEQIVLDAQGAVGDAHAGAWHRQVSLLGQEEIEAFAGELGRPIGPGEFAENITTAGLDLGPTRLLDRFRLGQVLLEVTQIGKECHGQGCAIFRQVGKCVMPKRGIFTRVIDGGTIKPGEAVARLPRQLKAAVVTLSDRAAAGVYADKAGPKIEAAMAAFCDQNGWLGLIEREVMADDEAALEQKLRDLVAAAADVIITCGSTGVGPRDMAPQAAERVCDRLIPGIMDHIRLKYGQGNPNALLSRSVAGAADRTLIYTLPGSSRAVDEYMTEITVTLEHLLYMLRGLDTH